MSEGDYMNECTMAECQRCGSLGGFGCYECTPVLDDQTDEAKAFQQAIEAAEQRGYARGIEAAASWIENAAITETWEWPEAIRALSPAPPAPVTPKVKPLVWGFHPAGQLASNNMGGSYIIDTRGPRPKWLKWPGGHGPDRETVGEMQAAAQADYERRIYEALTEVEG